MTPSLAMLALALQIFAHDAPALEARSRAAMAKLCPCPAPSEASCDAQHERAAKAIATAATTPADAIDLLGLGCHETRFATQHESGGRGRAVTWWQLEVPKAQRAALLADDAAAARAALAAWHHGPEAYACGSHCPDKARELQRYVASARWAWQTAATP